MGILFEVDGATGIVQFKQKGTSQFVTETGASDPVSPAPVVGQIFYNTTSQLFKVWNGSTWTSSGFSSSGAAGSIQFAGGSGAFASDPSNFFWDSANKRLGLGTNTPSASLTLFTASATAESLLFDSTGSFNAGGITLTAGASRTGGSILLTSTSSGQAGEIKIQGVGAGGTGNISIFGSVNGTAGNIELRGGGIAGNGGGNIVLTTAASGSSGDGGDITLTTRGDPGVPYTGLGGNIFLTANTPSNGGNITLNGVGASRGVINTKNFFDFTAVVTPPAVSASGHGRMYFDTTNERFMVSENGGAYTLIGGVPVGAGLQNFAVVVGTPSGPYTGSTTVFDLPFSYITGSGNLLVYSSGLLMGVGGANDYLETTTTRVTFNSARTSGEIVRFVYSPNGVAFQIGAIAAKTTTYTMVSTDHTILANATSGAFAVTLPAVASTTGYEFQIKKTDSSANSVTVTPASGTIDGAASFVLTSQYQSVSVTSDGTNWWII